jgi:hypothetical protein
MNENITINSASKLDISVVKSDNENFIYYIKHL